MQGLFHSTNKIHRRDVSVVRPIYFAPFDSELTPKNPLPGWIFKRKESHPVHARADIETLVRNGQLSAMFHGYPTAPHRKFIRPLIHSEESGARVCPESFRFHRPHLLWHKKPPSNRNPREVGFPKVDFPTSPLLHLRRLDGRKAR